MSEIFFPNHLSATVGITKMATKKKSKHNKRYSNRSLSVPERHQLRIAYDTLKLSDIGAQILGGMTKDEAREIIQKFTGSSPE